jgi:uracil-DNA glycosylase family 4
LKGFYTPKKVEVSRKKKVKINRLKGGCESCKAYTKCKNGKFPVSGSGRNGIMIIDGVVSTQEETTGEAFSGITQKYLSYKLQKLGIDLNECWYVHSVRCYCGTEKEKVTTPMKNGCKDLLWKDIKKLQPKKIILLGDLPVHEIYSDRLAKSRVNSGVEKFYGLSIPDQELSTWVFPNYSPREVLEPLSKKIDFLKKKNKLKTEKKPLWEWKCLSNDSNFRLYDLYFTKYLKNAIYHKKPFTVCDFKKRCVSLETPEEAASIIKSLNKPGRLAMDFETDRIGCYHPDADLITISLATKDVSYGFEYYKNNPEFMKALRDLLSNPEITFIIHNTEMELSWSRTVIGVNIENIIDTLLMSHFLRPAISGGDNLKFNALEVCGVLGYDEEVEQYISSPSKDIWKRGKKKKEKKSIYSKNRMREMPMRSRNLYCANDSFFTYRVFEHKYPLIQRNKKQFNLFNLYLEGQHVFVEAGEVGFTVDEEQMIKNLRTCDENLIRLGGLIAESDELKLWYKNNTKEFNPDSGDHLREFFFDLLGYDTPKRTDRGLKSTDGEVLNEIGKESPVAKLIAEYAKYSKIETFIEGIQRNTVEGILHARVGLSRASTGRSNSTDPNMQNTPKHDKMSERMVNEILKAPEGFELYCPDYSQLESRGGYSIHGDLGVKEEILNPDLDTHSAMAQAIFLDNEKATQRIAELKDPDKDSFTEDELKDIFEEELRTHGKTINFLSLFGGGIGKMYQSLYFEGFKSYHKKYFAEIGIDTSEKFREHCKSIHEAYWARYVDLKKWRDDFWENYLRTGEAWSPEGWCLNTMASKNLVTNFCIQGGSFACGLRGLVLLHRKMKERGYKSKILLMIHDSVEIATTFIEYFDKGLKELVEECMVDYVNENTDWLKINMEMDGEFFLGNWANGVKEEDWRREYEKSQIPLDTLSIL